MHAQTCCSIKLDSSCLACQLDRARIASEHFQAYALAQQPPPTSLPPAPSHLPAHPPPADVVVVSEPLPATKGILVRSTVRFQADAAGARAQADALVKYLTDATLLKQMLPEANWHPRLAYTTLPYLVRRQCARAWAGGHCV